ncbi:site-specific integrase [Curvibacter sp. HBC28]|uniref:Site-specific integrase n=1 Tax=Curvibacter microcysteis TaxID=3026419 RepID=A0ABT5MJ18_9BURK|nr:site-specific integrase [Curvibacter sp. HBC28]MDD0815190.1 site-specific integrase [Curvibacter sp. HBC28]
MKLSIPPAALPALNRDHLGQAAHQAVQELLQEGESANTRRSYQGALRYWAAWYQLRYGDRPALPWPPAVVMQFIVDHAQRSTPQGLVHELPPSVDTALVAARFKAKPGPMSLNWLIHRVAVLSKSHQLAGVANPCEDPLVRHLLGHTRRAYAKRGELPVKKDALTKDPLSALLATCDDSLKGLRDRALLLFAWSSGGRRRAEVSGAEMRFLKRVSEDAYIYQLLHSKSNQAGQDRPENDKPIQGEAARALSAWLDASGIQDGPLFRRVLKGGHLGPPLSPAAVRDIVKARCQLAGLEGDFSAHSLRSGFVTEAGAQGIALAQTMAMTSHRSVATVMGYMRTQSAQVRAAATLMDGERPGLNRKVPD